MNPKSSLTTYAAKKCENHFGNHHTIIFCFVTFPLTTHCTGKPEPVNKLAWIHPQLPCHHTLLGNLGKTQSVDVVGVMGKVLGRRGIQLFSSCCFHCIHAWLYLFLKCPVTNMQRDKTVMISCYLLSDQINTHSFLHWRLNLKRSQDAYF